MKRRRVAGKGEKERILALTARSVANGARTRERILAVAEKLFASNGFDGTSIRQIAQDASVPLALVSYHFKSKLGLYKTVFRTRLDEITKRRLSLLQNVGKASGPPATVREIARILVQPIVEMETNPQGRSIARLIARESNDPRESERGIIEENFDEIAQLAISKLKGAFPETDIRAVYWAYLFAVGALAINHAATGRIERLSSNLCRSDDADSFLNTLIHFITGGIIAALDPNKAAQPDRAKRGTKQS